MDEADIYAIHRAKSEIREGYNTGDAERILRYYGDQFSDCCFGIPGLDGDEPKTVLRARLAHLFSVHTVRFAPIIVRLRVFGDFAVAHGSHILTLEAKSDRVVQTLRTRFVEFWQKHADGVWRISYQIDNRELSPVLVDVMLDRVARGLFDEVTRGVGTGAAG